MPNGRIIGIVGSEGAKFTPETESKARELIKTLLGANDVVGVASGGCHLGGIDIWAEEEADRLGFLAKYIYKPATLQWSTGYKPRNLEIAKKSDEVHCITLAKLPTSYTGMTFPLCYHCGVNTHVKSGGCWTVKQGVKMGKPGLIHVISAEN